MNPFNEYYLINNLKMKRNDEIKLVDYITAYAENMSYIRTNSVEICVCTFTLSCVEDIEQVLSEINRILKPVSLIF
jgi:ubiquinone/menaquinone biosynthesis C-methylase UbiE